MLWDPAITIPLGLGVFWAAFTLFFTATGSFRRPARRR